MSLSVTPSLWPRRIAANGCSQVLSELSTKPHVEGLNFPDHPERIQMLSDLTRQKNRIDFVFECYYWREMIPLIKLKKVETFKFKF